MILQYLMRFLSYTNKSTFVCHAANQCEILVL